MAWAVVIAGLVNAALAGAILILRGLSGGNRAAAMLGGILLLASAAAGLILATDGVPRQLAPLSHLAETGLTLAAGPFLVVIVDQLLARKAPWPALGALFAIACLLVGAAAAAGADPILIAVPIQFGFTAFAWLRYARGRLRSAADRRTRAHRRARAALVLLTIVSIVHLAQLVRLVLPDDELLRPIVPFTMGGVFLLLTLLLAARLLNPRSLAALAPHADEAGSADLLERVRGWLQRSGSIADPDLRAEQAARALAVPLSELNAAAAAGGDAGFPAFLQRQRVDAAKRQLSDPAERRTSIEAIALGCGFRSRSAFYEAFRRETGTSPGAYRRQGDAGNLS